MLQHTLFSFCERGKGVVVEGGFNRPVVEINNIATRYAGEAEKLSPQHAQTRSHVVGRLRISKTF